MPLSVMEGMATKLPVIATSVGALPELLENGKLGLLIDVGDYKALAHNIVFLLSHPDIAKLFAQKAYEKIINTYDITKISSDVDSLYKEMLNYRTTTSQPARMNK